MPVNGPAADGTESRAQPPAAAIGVAGHDRTAVAADFVRQLTDDELGKLDPALLHRLPGLIDDATQRNRAQAALTASLAGAAKRSGV